MKSLVDNFEDKRISIQTLERMLSVDYQRNTLLELVNSNYENQEFEIKLGNQYFLTLNNLEHLIFLLLSSKEETLERVKKEMSLSEKSISVIVFDKSDKFNFLKNKVHVSTKDWMNRIISHGINRQILDLQYLRDLKYYYD